MPRMALGYLFLPAVSLLAGCGVAVATPAEVDEALAAVEALAAELGPARPAADNEAKRLALAIGDRVPAIYGGPATGTVASRWKTDVEENAKSFALAGALPEMNHNEIEAWQLPAAKDMHAILLRDAGESTEIAPRFRVLIDHQVSDAVLDAVIRQDPTGRVACETLLTTGLVVVAGEITTNCYVDIPRVARETIREIGYTRAKYGFYFETCGVIAAIDEQSSDIAMGVDNLGPGH